MRKVKVGKRYQLVGEITKEGNKQVMMVTSLAPNFQIEYKEVQKCIRVEVVILERVPYKLHGKKQMAYRVDFQCVQDNFVLEWQLLQEIKD